MTRIGWIGLGNMGAPMARNAAAAGFDLTAYDLSPDARSSADVPTVDSPVEALRDADIVVTMLPKGEHVRAALVDSGALNSAQPGALVIDCSTIAVDDATALAEAVTAQGRRYVDAPVSGGTAGAEAGTLTFMVGGEAAEFETAQPLLEAMGSRSFHVGAAGAGQAIKMINNMMLATNLQGLAEAAVLADRLGVDHSTLIDVASVSSGDSWVLRNYYPIAGPVPSAPSARDFHGGFSVALMAKDLGLALASAEALEVDAAAAREVSRRLQKITDEGDVSLDFSSIVNLLEPGTTSDSARTVG
ncbi:3-hydroxyisobutyrate dehydrogenase [Dietzia aurantiaca]|uniref:3-hydroxyisobutyrate dehydrogenase n=1 Tax=Dietzia aurantiaca TaxID=983873 RepID=A0ABV9PK97_9ACTN